MAKTKFDVDGKLVVVAGGSKGLGKAMALELAAKGANLLLLARTHEALMAARQDVQAACKEPKQIVDAISVDLTKPEDVDTVLSRYHPPDILICTAGGTPNQIGFLADIPPSAITSCLEMNYYTTVFPVQSCLKRWRTTPQTAKPPDSTRHIILTSSLAAFLGLPGYDAYTPAKAAIRALTDTLRQEFLMYGADAYKVHCSFPGNFLSDSFFQEQAGKPTLLKTLEYSDMSRAEMERKVPSAKAIARRIIAGVECGKTYITVDLEGDLLLNSMRGPSPRFWTLYDLFLGWLAILVGWVYRLECDRKIRRYGREKGLDRS